MVESDQAVGMFQMWCHKLRATKPLHQKLFDPDAHRHPLKVAADELVDVFLARPRNEAFKCWRSDLLKKAQTSVRNGYEVDQQKWLTACEDAAPE